MKAENINIINLYQKDLEHKITSRGLLTPLIGLISIFLFTAADYLVLDLFPASLPYRLLLIIPLTLSLLASLFNLSGKILLWLQKLWLLGANLMMAGLIFLVFTEYGTDVTLKYGTILGYSIVIYLSILISNDRSIITIIVIPLILTTIGIYLSMDSKEVILITNLYIVVAISLYIVLNQQKQQFQSFKNKLIIEDLNKRLEDFAHISSHDLRSPLGTISMHLDIIEKRISEGELNKAIKMFSLIRNAVKNIDQLLEDILTYSKVTTTADDIAWINLHSVLDSLRDNLSKEIQESEGNIEIESNLPWVKGNESRIYQIFQNLLGNAIKYRDPEKPLSIMIKVFTGEKEVIIAVQDNGLGIPEHMLERVFKPFERYHTHVRGSGLGLAMVNKHMELLGGRTSLNSKEGKGTSFFLHFPKNSVLQRKENIDENLIS